MNSAKAYCGRSHNVGHNKYKPAHRMLSCTNILMMKKSLDVLLVSNGSAS
jgi:hypothetical protein